MPSVNGLGELATLTEQTQSRLREGNETGRKSLQSRRSTAKTTRRSFTSTKKLTSLAIQKS
jgi:hypothetical protein